MHAYNQLGNCICRKCFKYHEKTFFFLIMLLYMLRTRCVLKLYCVYSIHLSVFISSFGYGTQHTHAHDTDKRQTYYGAFPFIQYENLIFVIVLFPFCSIIYIVNAVRHCCYHLRRHRFFLFCNFFFSRIYFI